MFEHGYDQADAVQTLFRQYGFESIETRRDYGGQPRVTFGQWPKTAANETC
jgi:release factor glutamine methyltransferase